MEIGPGRRQFATTQWSLVLAARSDEGDETRARQALEQLCRAYWYPLYAYLRRRGESADDAADLVEHHEVAVVAKKHVDRGDQAAGARLVAAGRPAARPGSAFGSDAVPADTVKSIEPQRTQRTQRVEKQFL